VKPTKVTLEPNEKNTQGVALTLYCPNGTTVAEATEWLRTADRRDFWSLPLWVDVEDRFFEVLQAKKQLPGFVCFQAHPTC